MSETSPAPRTWKQWWRKLFWRSVFLFVIYTLSIGPMFWTWFEATHVDGPRWVAALYLPLVLLCDLCPPFGTVVNWYVDLWIL